ncbi:MAG: hypothetical protein KDK08_05215 [Rhizobiaceae bacterium]|nr:hypothetical protein [Rhizobiaceae bacterium]MCC0000869.1 hypothetical protein [Methylobacteriaceae bacterium]
MIEGEILGRTQAQDYVRLALFAIRIKGVKADDLRDWWRDEKPHREKYGLDEAQIKQLVDACQARIDEIRFDPTPPARKGRRNPHQPPLI